MYFKTDMGLNLKKNNKRKRWGRALLVSERFYWFKFRCTPRRIECKDYADADTER